MLCTALLLALTPVFFAQGGSVPARHITLARDGASDYSILCPVQPTATEAFASQELQHYLQLSSKATLPIVRAIAGRVIVATTFARLQELLPQNGLGAMKDEQYEVRVNDDRILLVGGNERAVLYAVYDFLGKFGIRFPAPDLDSYENRHEVVPFHSSLHFNIEDNYPRRSPAFKYRKLYVEEGRTHSADNLLALIDWMPKANYNTLVIPINYEGHDRVMWDNWRDLLTPELERRGIQIEVGGHGYQNFLNAEMQNGKLYEDHEEWFGLDQDRHRSRDPHRVFCTSNAGAVSYLHHQLLNYLQQHKEIDIFDFWPPDSEQWCTCNKCTRMGDPSQRHAILVSQTADFLRSHHVDVKVECIAYSRYLNPPEKGSLSEDILVDFCPIRQSFEYQIFDEQSPENKEYKNALVKWTQQFGGDVSLYSYYRKYAWKSLPVILPHYMQRDLAYYQQLGVKGISVYSEPGDWFTYGVNHFTLGQLAWNPSVNVDSVVNEYCTAVFGHAAELASKVFTDLEDVTRVGCGIPHTLRKEDGQYAELIARINDDRMLIDRYAGTVDKTIRAHLSRLSLMLTYAIEDMRLMQMKATSATTEELSAQQAIINQLIAGHATEGIFVPRRSQVRTTPNIVLIVADDLGFGDLGCYGATKIATPALDRLARDGERFTNAYVTSSLCTPSRYSILTGRYAWRTRLKYGVLSYFDKPLIDADQTTIASLLQRNGYYTACVGKWHLGMNWSLNDNAPANPDSSVFSSSAGNLQQYIDFGKKIGDGPTTRGFDYFFGMAGSNNMQPYVLIENDSVLLPPTVKQLPYDHYIDALRAPNWNIQTLNQDLTHKATDVINNHFARQQDQPLFLYFPTSAPHRPCLPTFTKGKSQAGLRGDMVEELDWSVSEIVKALKANNELENTLFIFTSDNGPRPGDPALWMKTYEEDAYEDFHQPYFDQYNPEYIDPDGNKIWKAGWFTYGHHASGEYIGFKSDAWDGGLRVPLIIHWPDGMKGNTQSAAFVSTADLMATIADIISAKLAPHEGGDSYSFFNCLGNPDALPGRASLVATAGASGAFIALLNNWKYIEAAVPGRWPETYYPNGPSKLEQQLYNLKADPREQNNLISKNKKRTTDLIRLIERVKAREGTEQYAPK